MNARIGSLFTGTGALDLAAQAVFGGQVVWHCQYEPPDKNGREDKNQYAAKILARHWPDVPNLGDVTVIDWQAVLAEHGPVDILTGGFPCQDVSSAGKRAGLTAGSRSGLWAHFARAIHELQPRLVVIENVEGLLSADADRGLGLDAEALEEEAEAGRVLRALGAVLGDLATLGFHAEWERVGADEVGAPHRRRRVVIYAWPAAVDPRCIRWGDGSGIVGGLRSAGRGTEAVQNADLQSGDERRFAAPGQTQGGRAWSDLGGRSGTPAADAQGAGLQGMRPEPARLQGGSDAAQCGGPVASSGSGPDQWGPSAGRNEAAADSDGRGCEGNQERGRRPHDGQPQREPGLDPVGRGVQRPTPSDAEGLRHGDAGEEGERGVPAAAVSGGDSAGGGAAPADADLFGRRADVLQLRPGQPDLDWGDYGPAIRRWEAVLGRPAPWPTDALGRLSPVFTEWMMGLPDGWVTCTPGLTRSAMLRALGNGVVPQQAVAALRLLHDRACEDTAETAA